MPHLRILLSSIPLSPSVILIMQSHSVMPFVDLLNLAFLLTLYVVRLFLRAFFQCMTVEVKKPFFVRNYSLELPPLLPIQSTSCKYLCNLLICNLFRATFSSKMGGGRPCPAFSISSAPTGFFRSVAVCLAIPARCAASAKCTYSKCTKKATF